MRGKTCLVRGSTVNAALARSMTKSRLDDKVNNQFRLINVFYILYFISFTDITHIIFLLDILIIPSMQHACTLTLDSAQQATSQATIGPFQGFRIPLPVPWTL